MSATLQKKWTNTWRTRGSKCFSPPATSRWVLIFLSGAANLKKQANCVNARDMGSIPGLGRSPWRRKWQPTPVFLPGKIPWTEEPGGLQYMEFQRVRHGLATKQKQQKPYHTQYQFLVEILGGLLSMENWICPHSAGLFQDQLIFSTSSRQHTFPFSMYFFISISILSITQHKEDHYHRPLTPSISWIGFKSTLVCLLSTLPKAKARPQGLIIAWVNYPKSPWCDNLP